MYLFSTLILLSSLGLSLSHRYYHSQHINGQTFSNDGYRPPYQRRPPTYNNQLSYPDYSRKGVRGGAGNNRQQVNNLEVENENGQDNVNPEQESSTPVTPQLLTERTQPNDNQETVSRNRETVSDNRESVSEEKPLTVSGDKPLKAIAVLRGKAKGILYFEQKSDKVHVTGSIDGLTNGLHAFHVHDYGDLSRSCDSSGDHYNPHKTKHGSPFDSIRHVGDLGNVFADESGVAKIDIQDKFLTLRDGKNNIIGHTIIVHENVDDLGRGGHVKAGRRIGCGIIGWRNDLE